MVAIPDLWPGVKFDILAPSTILKRQVEYLRAKGEGVLDAELTSITGEQDFVIHRLDLLTNHPDTRRYRVLVATHRSEFYPIQIEADCFRPKTRTVTHPGIMGVMNALNQPTTSVESLTWPPENDWKRIARNQTEFISVLGEVLRSSEVRSAIESFIARRNEASLSPSGSGVQESTEAGLVGGEQAL